MSDLRPCPFCNAKATLTETDLGPWKHVACILCGAQGPEHTTTEQAVIAWNTRANVWHDWEKAPPTDGVPVLVRGVSGEVHTGMACGGRLSMRRSEVRGDGYHWRYVSEVL